MRIKFPLFAAIAFICLDVIFARQVRADSVDSFVYQFGGNTFTWELPSSRLVTPDNVSYGFTLPDVSVSENGGPATSGTLDFWSDSAGGGVDFYVGNFFYLFNTTGPQFYSGSDSSPTFLTGTFGSLTDYGDGFDGVPEGTLQISAAVPEPPSLTLLWIGLGFALVLYVAHRLVPSRSMV